MNLLDFQHKRFWFSAAGITFMAVIVCFILTLVICNFQVAVTEGSLIVDDIILATGISTEGKPTGVGHRFSTTESRIYCYVSVTSQKPIRVGIRWYRDNELIYQDEAMVNQWRAFYIEPLQGDVFQPGDYQVEIYLIRKTVRKVDFVIE